MQLSWELEPHGNQQDLHQRQQDTLWQVHLFAARTMWTSCLKVQDKYLKDIGAELEMFNFCHLNLNEEHLASFIKFLNWVYFKVGSSWCD